MQVMHPTPVEEVGMEYVPQVLPEHFNTTPVGQVAAQVRIAHGEIPALQTYHNTVASNASPSSALASGAATTRVKK